MNEGMILYAMAYRQIKRYLRARSRLIGTIINPLMFFLFLGLGWSVSFRGEVMRQALGGQDYLTFLAPGIVMMTVFTGSLVGGISVIWDREFGFLKEVLVAPASRSYAITGRALGDSVTSLLQGLIVLGALHLFTPSLRVEGLIPVLLVGFMTAITFNSLGIAIASKIRSPEGFQLIMNFLTLPLTFMSGAFYPIDKLPEYVKPVFYADPLTYAVDLARTYLTGVSSLSPLIDWAVLLSISAIFLMVSIRIFGSSTID